jgi:hypothetical protein
MLTVPYAVLRADGVVDTDLKWRVTSAKLDALEAKGDDAVDGLLRTKMKRKGYHGSWVRYGSWTFHEDDACADDGTLLFAWAYAKGVAAHAAPYSLEGDTVTVFDDLLLMRFPPTASWSLRSALPVTPGHVAEWLECVREAPALEPVKTEATGDAVFEIDDVAFSANDLTFALPVAANDSGTDSDSEADVPSTAPTVAPASDEEENDSDADDAPIDAELFDDDEGEEESAGPQAKEEEDDEEEAVHEDVLEANMLQYEDYVYHDETIPCELPSQYSLWTAA